MAVALLSHVDRVLPLIDIGSRDICISHCETLGVARCITAYLLPGSTSMSRQTVVYYSRSIRSQGNTH